MVEEPRKALAAGGQSREGGGKGGAGTAHGIMDPSGEKN